jgi:hypothetical protein
MSVEVGAATSDALRKVIDSRIELLEQERADYQARLSVSLSRPFIAEWQDIEQLALRVNKGDRSVEDRFIRELERTHVDTPGNTGKLYYEKYPTPGAAYQGPVVSLPITEGLSNGLRLGVLESSSKGDRYPGVDAFVELFDKQLEGVGFRVQAVIQDGAQLKIALTGEGLWARMYELRSVNEQLESMR